MSPSLESLPCSFQFGFLGGWFSSILLVLVTPLFGLCPLPVQVHVRRPLLGGLQRGALLSSGVGTLWICVWVTPLYMALSMQLPIPDLFGLTV